VEGQHTAGVLHAVGCHEIAIFGGSLNNTGVAASAMAAFAGHVLEGGSNVQHSHLLAAFTTSRAAGKHC